MTAERNRRLFWLFTLLSLAYGQVLGSWTVELGRRVDGGIVALELAGLLGDTEGLLDCFEGGEKGRNLLPVVRRQLLLDFPYLMLYPVAIGLGCLLARRRLKSIPLAAPLGLALARGQVLAGLFDAAENLALLHLVSLHRAGALPAGVDWALAAAVFACLKFVLVGAGLFYAAAGVVHWLGEEVGPYCSWEEEDRPNRA